MRIRPRLKSIVRNKETSKLPYWVEDEYSDFQQLTSQKYIQDNYGKFPESEFQQPYKLDEEDDYQFLEYLYSVPEFPTIPIPDVDVTKTRPKGNCEELWRELFGDSKVPFIPDESDWSKIRKYAEKCPLEYLPHICCKDMKINGPTDVTPGQTVEYTVTGGLPGCAYSWKSGKGRMVEGTYTAPDTSGTDEISVSPWMSDDQDKKCAKKSITIGKACNGVIAYTTLQMQVSTTQTLTVTGAVEGETYSWSTTSGSVSPSKGTSVTFTAPATNPNCANNATVSITCGGNVVDSITIAVRANSFDYNKAAYYITQGGGPGTPIGDPANPAFILRDCEYSIHLVPVRCDGSIPRTWSMPTCGYDYANPYTGTCPHCAVLKYNPPGCWGNWAFDRVTDMAHAEAMCSSAAPKNTDFPRYYGIPCNCAIGAVYDVRTAQQKADGCCPAGLL